MACGPPYTFDQECGAQQQQIRNLVSNPNLTFNCCTKTYADSIGVGYTVFQILYAVLFVSLAIIAAKMLKSEFRRVNCRSILLAGRRKRLLYRQMVVAVSFAITAIDPFGWRAILPLFLVQALYDITYCALFSIGITAVYNLSTAEAKLGEKKKGAGKVRDHMCAYHLIHGLLYGAMLVLLVGEYSSSQPAATYWNMARSVFISASVVLIAAFGGRFGLRIYQLSHLLRDPRDPSTQSHTNTNAERMNSTEDGSQPSSGRPSAVVPGVAASALALTLLPTSSLAPLPSASSSPAAASSSSALSSNAPSLSPSSPPLSSPALSASSSAAVSSASSFSAAFSPLISHKENNNADMVHNKEHSDGKVGDGGDSGGGKDGSGSGGGSQGGDGGEDGAGGEVGSGDGNGDGVEVVSGEAGSGSGSGSEGRGFPKNGLAVVVPPNQGALLYNPSPTLSPPIFSELDHEHELHQPLSAAALSSRGVPSETGHERENFFPPAASPSASERLSATQQLGTLPLVSSAGSSGLNSQSHSGEISESGKLGNAVTMREKEKEKLVDSHAILFDTESEDERASYNKGKDYVKAWDRSTASLDEGSKITNTASTTVASQSISQQQAQLQTRNGTSSVLGVAVTNPLAGNNEGGKDKQLLSPSASSANIEMAVQHSNNSNDNNTALQRAPASFLHRFQSPSARAVNRVPHGVNRPNSSGDHPQSVPQQGGAVFASLIQFLGCGGAIGTATVVLYSLQAYHHYRMMKGLENPVPVGAAAMFGFHSHFPFIILSLASWASFGWFRILAALQRVGGGTHKATGGKGTRAGQGQHSTRGGPGAGAGGQALNTHARYEKALEDQQMAADLWIPADFADPRHRFSTVSQVTRTVAPPGGRRSRVVVSQWLPYLDEDDDEEESEEESFEGGKEISTAGGAGKVKLGGSGGGAVLGALGEGAHKRPLTNRGISLMTTKKKPSPKEEKLKIPSGTQKSNLGSPMRSPKAQSNDQIFSFASSTRPGLNGNGSDKKLSPTSTSGSAAPVVVANDA